MYMCIHLDLLQVEMYLNVHCYTFQMTFLYISDVYKLAIRNIKIISFSNFSNLFTFLSKPPCEGGRVGASLYNTNLRHYQITPPEFQTYTTTECNGATARNLVNVSFI